jgi:tRNA uridine 5-carboxymethylaminomethyl modification enzyme
MLTVDLDYSLLHGLSAEVRQELVSVRARSLGQANQIEGTMPVALGIVAASARRSSTRYTPCVDLNAVC